MISVLNRRMSEDEIIECPLVTPYTEQLGISSKMLEKLYAVRKWELDEVNNPIPFYWPKLLRTTIYNTNKQVDTDLPLRVRQYQIQAIHHLTRMRRFVLGDSVGLGKTLSAIAAFCWLKERHPEYKLVVVTTKSTVGQWFDEISRFSHLRAYIMRDTYNSLKSSEARYQQLSRFLSGDKKDVIIVKYSSLIGTRKLVEGKFDDEGNPVKGKERISAKIKTFTKILKEHKEKVVIVFDEAHRFKNAGSSTRTLVFNLSHAASTIWALTATVIQNGMEEFASIACAIGIQPFESMWEFKDRFCITRKQYIGRGRHKEIIVGYKNVAQFKAMIRPFFLGRSQKQVKEPLPKLTTVYHPVDLDKKQAQLLLEDIPNGVYVLPPTIIKDMFGNEHEVERDPDNLMTQLSVQQLVANHWALLDRNNEKDFHTTKLSPKEEALLDLIDGDYRSEKIVVYTKFRCLVDRLQWLTEQGHFTDRKFLRITGAENEKQREDAKRKFQDPTSGYDLLIINDAALEGVNLQSAAHLM